jgi:hypothetical protein
MILRGFSSCFLRSLIARLTLGQRSLGEDSGEELGETQLSAFGA